MTPCKLLRSLGLRNARDMFDNGQDWKGAVRSSKTDTHTRKSRTKANDEIVFINVDSQLVKMNLECINDFELVEFKCCGLLHFFKIYCILYSCSKVLLNKLDRACDAYTKIYYNLLQSFYDCSPDALQLEEAQIRT